MGTAIQVDASGNAYVAGMTSSPNFPTVNAFQPVRGGGTMDAFVAKLNPAGSALLYSTYLGGVGVDYAYGIAVTSSGAATVAGYTSSSNFPVSGAVQPLKSGGYDGFLARLAPAGNALEMATYWGGSDSEAVYAVARDSAGNTWIAGQTLSTNFPLKNPIQSLNAGGYSAFVTKLGAGDAHGGLPVVTLRIHHHDHLRLRRPVQCARYHLQRSGDFPELGWATRSWRAGPLPAAST